MRRPVAIALVMLSIVAGMGVGYAVGRSGESTAKTTASPPATEQTTQPSTPPATPVQLGLLEPGRLGPIEVGMSVHDAAATGLLRRDSLIDEVCNGKRHHWRMSGADGIEISTTGRNTGVVAAIGVSRPEVETVEGITIGHTYADLKRAYGEDLVSLAPKGVEPDRVFVGEGERYIGFKLEEGPYGITDASKITFIELSRGPLPSLDRGLC